MAFAHASPELRAKMEVCVVQCAGGFGSHVFLFLGQADMKEIGEGRKAKGQVLETLVAEAKESFRNFQNNLAILIEEASRCFNNVGDDVNLRLVARGLSRCGTCVDSLMDLKEDGFVLLGRAFAPA